MDSRTNVKPPEGVSRCFDFLPGAPSDPGDYVEKYCTRTEVVVRFGEARWKIADTGERKGGRERGQGKSEGERSNAGERLARAREEWVEWRKGRAQIKRNYLNAVI